MRSSKPLALLRIAFGIVWAVDAWFKWQPAFFSGFVGYFTDAQAGQPAVIATWIQWWVRIIAPHAYAWALLTACAETAIAFGLIFGLFTRLTIISGAVLSFFIWALPEGFGMVFVPGATDPGAGIVYVLVFAALWFSDCWEIYSVDSFTRSSKRL